MKYILALTLLLSGCAMVQESEVVLSKVVADYCKAPEIGRMAIRHRVQAALYPNSIKIDCAD